MRIMLDAYRWVWHRETSECKDLSTPSLLMGVRMDEDNVNPVTAGCDIKRRARAKVCHP